MPRLTTPDLNLTLHLPGGMIAPVTFDRRRRKLQPLHIAPWTRPPESRRSAIRTLPVILRDLRGDFFCLPFGANAATPGIPLHGDPANRPWKLLSRSATRLSLSLTTRRPAGKVRKEVFVLPGSPAVHQLHTPSGYRSRVCFGHHAMIHCRDEYGPARLQPLRTRSGHPRHVRGPRQGRLRLPSARRPILLPLPSPPRHRR